MRKKLAIRGHSTRGKEVIELLEMIGGKNTLVVDGYKLSGYEPFNLYYINDNGIINHKYHSLIKDMDIFTLEEFLEEYPFKVGDKVVDCYGNPVTIKSMKWSDDFETMVYDFEESEDVLCAEDIESMNDIHTKPPKMKIVLAELLEHIKTTPKEELEREFEELEEWSNVGPTVEEFRTFCECVNRKPKYLKTYKECCDVLLIPPYYNLRYHTYEHCYNEYAASNTLLSLQDKLNTLGKLIICRDAYWKIAGEEMGLDKPWKPDWKDYQKSKWYIYWNILTNRVTIDSHHTYKSEIAYFKTPDLALQAIEILGEEEVKLALGV